MDAQDAKLKRLTLPIRVGSVSFLNAKPLIYGLEREERIALSLAVPSALLGEMQSGALDVALLPVIDYQKIDSVIVPSGGIGCDGETLTVRIFSHVPMGEIRTLGCDADSHTSIALARVLFAERFGWGPELVERGGGACDALLLIGDKVVCEEPVGFAYQIDLGQAWREMTGLPFVFAVWTARRGVELGETPELLRKARVSGLEHVGEIVEGFGVRRGWPVALARRYLTEYLQFEIGDRQIRAIGLFHELAGKHGILSGGVRGLELYSEAIG